MIARIDILDTPDPASAVRAWSLAMREAALTPGFRGALLHRVYRRMNREGYALVSVARWESLAAYHETDAASPVRPYDAQTKSSPNLYALVDASEVSNVPVYTDQLVVTNPYRISREAAGENARMWNATKKMMEDREGFLDAELFQTFNPHEDEYYFVSRARWESEASFLRQFAGKDYKALVAPFEGTFQICFSTVQDVVAGHADAAPLRLPLQSIETAEVTP